MNFQENRKGSLFRKETKAICLTCFKGLTPNFIKTESGTTINIEIAEKQYPQICFNYIQENPVKAGLIAKITNWEFSSARDFYGNRNGKLINKERTKEFIY
jgi:putative transposase